MSKPSLKTADTQLPMKRLAKKTLKKLSRRSAPVTTQAYQPENRLDSDIEAIWQAAKPYTMTGRLRIEALVKATRYCHQRNIPGAIVECGVWKGGSILSVILELIASGITNRDIYLYDTFEGMTEPTEHDVAIHDGESALIAWNKALNTDEKIFPEFFSSNVFHEDGVRGLIEKTGYPQEKIHFVKGKVEETIPDYAPDKIALLRLDTDWYESTLHELTHLYPRLSTTGVLIIDDYGHWEGCRKAVDEFFAQGSVAPILLNKIDYTGRLAIKV